MANDNGVPSLPPGSSEPVQQVVITGDTIPQTGNASTKIWGIYQSNSPIIVPDSIVEFSYRNSSRISDYPLEEGSFETYNKVAEPYNSSVRMAKGTGGVHERTQFLTLLDSLANSLQLVDIVTPERIYINANITGYRLVRAAHSGASLLVVDVDFEEVRLSGSAAFSNTQQPDGSAPVNIGPVAPGAPQTLNFSPQ